jgi:basic amino acid/polyamine antiporter, APA family
MSREPSSLPRVLGIGGVAFASFNCIVGGGIFGLQALAAAALGAAAILGYLVCTVLLGLVALCFAEIGSRVTEAGGPFAYATVPFGSVVGGVVGTLMWVTCVSGSAAVAILWIETLATAWPAMNSTGPRTMLILGGYLALAAVNVRGARQGSRLSVALAVAKLVPLAGIVLIGSLAINPSNLRWTNAPSSTAVGSATVLLFVAFTGIEGGLFASGEVRNPRHTIPRAILLASLLVAALYMGLQVVAQGVLGAELPTATSPLVSVAEVVLGPWGSRLMFAAVLIALSGYLVADTLCSPRIPYALAARGQLPRLLATVHPKFDTPAVAIVLYTSLCALLAITGSFRALAVFASATTLVIYGVCCLGLLRLRMRNVEQAGTPFRAPGGAVVPLAAAALVGWLLWSLTRHELLATMAPIAVSGIAYGAQSWIRRPTSSPISSA